MKLKKLEIKNIASIENATIEFDGAPLSQSEVFLICGKTGSGKTTILDCLCLALYGCTPRFTNASSRNSGSTQNFNVIDNISLNDPRQLLSRNKGEGFTRLLFEGNDGKEYSAFWYVKRAYKKPDGNLSKPDWTVTCLESQETITGRKEIEDLISITVGLDFNQFTRTTVLAQGEFAKFIKSKEEEKANILEKVTSRDEFAKIGKKIAELTKERETAFNDAQARLEGNLTLPEEERKIMETRLTLLEAQYKEFKTLNDRLQKKKDWIDKEAEFKKMVLQSFRKLETAENRAKDEAISAKRDLVTKWNETAEPRRVIKEVEEKTNSLAALNNRLDELGVRFCQLLAGEKYLSHKVEGISDNISLIEDFLNQEEDYKDLYADSVVILAELAEILKIRTNITLKEKELTTYESIKQEADKTYGKLKESEEKLNLDIESKKEEINLKEDSLEKIGLKSLRENKERLALREKDLKGFKKDISDWISENEKISLTSSELVDARAVFAKMKVDSEALQKEVKEAEDEKNRLKAIYEEQKDSINKFAKELRSRLHPGDNCPVCRQKIEHPIISEEEIDTIARKAKEDSENANKIYEEVNKKYGEKLIELKTKENQISDKKKRLSEDSLKAIKGKNVLVSSFRELFPEYSVVSDFEESTLKNPDPFINKGLQEKINDALAKIKYEIDSLAAKVKEGEGLDRELKQLRKGLSGLEEERKKLALKIEDSREKIDKIKKGIEITRAFITQKKGEESERLDKVSTKTPDDWGLDVATQTEEFSKLLEKRSKKYADETERKKKLESEYTLLKLTLATSSQTISEIKKSIVPWREFKAEDITWDWCEREEQTEVNNLPEILSALLSEASALNGEISAASEAIAALKNKLKDWMKENPEVSIDDLRNLEAITSKDIGEKENEIREIDEEVIKARASHLNVSSSLEEHEKSRPEFNEDETAESIAQSLEETNKSMTQNLEETGRIRGEIEADDRSRQRAADMLADLQEKQSAYEKWKKLKDLIGDNEGKKFKKIAQSYVLGCLVNSANHYLANLSPRYTLHTEPNSFVLYVEDAWAGYARRIASTLSGGETFLVSLALALALSDIGEKITVDTMFIDEGFGTLSGEPLQRAVDTLRGLHMRSGRHVGVISHVDELRERIPVRIQVDRDGTDSFSKITVIEN